MTNREEKVVTNAPLTTASPRLLFFGKPTMSSPFISLNSWNEPGTILQAAEPEEIITGGTGDWDKLRESHLFGLSRDVVSEPCCHARNK